MTSSKLKHVGMTEHIDLANSSPAAASTAPRVDDFDSVTGETI